MRTRMAGARRLFAAAVLGVTAILAMTAAAPAQQSLPAGMATVTKVAHQEGPRHDMAGCCAPAGCNQNWYVSLSGGWADRQRVHEVGTQATFLTFDSGFAVNAALGHRFGDFRLEAEFSNMNTPLDRAGAGTPGGNLASSAVGNVDLRAYMLNVYYDIPLTSKLKPYVGAGIGFYQSELNGLYPAFFAAAGFGAINATSGYPLAYQFRAGVSYEICERVDIFAGYRFFRGEDLVFSSAPFGTFYPNGATVHAIEAGLRIKF